MPYAVRNAEGLITSLHRDDPGVGEPIAADDPDLLRFLGTAVDDPEAGDGGFGRLDAAFIRVLEDLIDALISRNLLTITELPDIAQTKLFARKSFRDRRSRNALDLLGPGDWT